MTTSDQWIDRFRTELEERDVPRDRVTDEVNTIVSHLSEAGVDADTAFGDPISYAATLAEPSDDGTPTPQSSMTLLAIIALFVVFAISGVRWADGDLASAPWATASGAALLVAVATLSVMFSRRAAASALRDHLSLRTEAQWRTSSTLLLLVPWSIIGFAALIVTVAAVA